MPIARSFSRPDPALVADMARRSTPTLHESMGRRGALASAIRPLWPGAKLCGPALTVAGGATDNLLLHLALAYAQPGDVLVVDAHAMTEAGPWGELMSCAAQARGVAGLVIDGMVRDSRQIRTMGFAVFCRGTCIKGTTKCDAAGTVNGPIACGGQVVTPGDLVIGDDDGVVTVPQTEAAAILDRAVRHDAREDAIRQKLRAGMTTIEALGLEDPLKRAGLVW